jgi:hypothetical protein
VNRRWRIPADARWRRVPVAALTGPGSAGARRGARRASTRGLRPRRADRPASGVRCSRSDRHRSSRSPRCSCGASRASRPGRTWLLRSGQVSFDVTVTPANRARDASFTGASGERCRPRSRRASGQRPTTSRRSVDLIRLAPGHYTSAGFGSFAGD